MTQKYKDYLSIVHCQDVLKIQLQIEAILKDMGDDGFMGFSKERLANLNIELCEYYKILDKL